MIVNMDAVHEGSLNKALNEPHKIIVNRNSNYYNFISVEKAFSNVIMNYLNFQ
jgi:hypothetical protein